VRRALHALEAQTDLILAMSVVRVFLVSFLDHSVTRHAPRMPLSPSPASDEPALLLPPYRPAVVRHLETEFCLLLLLTRAISALKAKFLQQASAFHLAATGAALPNDPQDISAKMQTELNALKVGGSLHSYSFTLDKVINLICFIQRTSFSTLLREDEGEGEGEGESTHLLLEFSAVQDIWTDVFLRAVTLQVGGDAFIYLLFIDYLLRCRHCFCVMLTHSLSPLQERELALGFIPRLVSLGRKRESGRALSPQDFLAYCSPASVRRIFEELLTPRSLLEAQGDCCSLSVLRCIEKFYCWLGVYQGYLELTRRPPPTSAGSARNYFVVVRPLSEHTEWQVFLSIAMTVTEVIGVDNIYLIHVFIYSFSRLFISETCCSIGMCCLLLISDCCCRTRWPERPWLCSPIFRSASRALCSSRDTWRAFARCCCLAACQSSLPHLGLGLGLNPRLLCLALACAGA
jgi:hypothetical protein